MERERTVYEEASKYDENAFKEIGIEQLKRMSQLSSWTKHKKPGRPRKNQDGQPGVLLGREWDLFCLLTPSLPIGHQTR